MTDANNALTDKSAQVGSLRRIYDCRIKSVFFAVDEVADTIDTTPISNLYSSGLCSPLRQMLRAV